MKRSRTSVAIATLLYLASLAAIGGGLWMCGSGDWRGVSAVVVGGLVWFDLMLATRGRRPEKPKRAS